MKRLVVKLSIQIIPFLLLVGCLSPFTIDIENAGGRVIISGQISTLADQNIVEIGVTADDARLPFPESNAIVKLHDDEGNIYDYYKNKDKSGVYVLPEVSGIPGKTYFIEVIMPNGDVYQSKVEKLPVSNGELTTHYEINSNSFIDLEGTLQTQPFAEVYATSKINYAEEKRYFRWHLEEAFMILETAYPGARGLIPPPCIIIQAAEPQRIVLLNGNEVNPELIENQLIGKRKVNWAFYYRFYFNTYQQSITKEAYDYWRKVNILANQVGSIFDSPPAKIEGNVYNTSTNNRTAGYFQASNTILDRILIHRFDLPSELPSYCDYDIFRNSFVNPYPKECSDCLSIRNSSRERPFWFE
jgi:hypothetical protein